MYACSQETDFVWGGCMLFRADDLRSDALGVLRSWAHGGYSDDLTVASQCNAHGVKVHCPSYAIFPQWYGSSAAMPTTVFMVCMSKSHHAWAWQ
jgi:Glycosyl transferase family 21